MTVGVKPRKVFRVRIWSALKYVMIYFCALIGENFSIIIKFTAGVVDLSFPEVSRGSNSYHIIR